MPDLRIVVVDGHESFRRAATEVVHTAVGCRLVASAASGAEALGAVGADVAVDLLVIDVDLPDLEGSTVAAELGRRHPGLAVLYVSALRVDDLPLEVLTRTEHAVTVRVVAKVAFDADCLTAVGPGRELVVYPDADARLGERTIRRLR
jgi:DNA-binding NarL/FixJ family response regulator